MGGIEMQPQDHVGRRVDDVFSDPEIRDSLSEPEEIDGESYFGSRALGVEFVVQDARVVTAHIHVLPEGDYAAYADDLPCQLRRDMTRQAVREILGTPIASGEPTRIPVLGESPAWDLFEVDSLWLNVSYRLDVPGLSQLSFMLPGTVSTRWQVAALLTSSAQAERPHLGRSGEGNALEVAWIRPDRTLTAGLRRVVVFHVAGVRRRGSPGQLERETATRLRVIGRGLRG